MRMLTSDSASVDEKTGSVILYQNTGVGDQISWSPVNEGKEIASGVAPRELIRFLDIDLDGKADYVVLGKETGSVTGRLSQVIFPEDSQYYRHKITIQLSK